MKAKCPRCKKENAIIHSSLGVIYGKKCQAELKNKTIRSMPSFGHPALASRIQDQRDHHLGDIQQPWLPDGTPNRTFVEANGKEVAEQYFSPEELKNLT